MYGLVQPERRCSVHTRGGSAMLQAFTGPIAGLLMLALADEGENTYRFQGSQSQSHLLLNVKQMSKKFCFSFREIKANLGTFIAVSNRIRMVFLS